MRWLLGFLFAISCSGSDKPSTATVDAGCPTVGPGQFGAACSDDCACASGVCFMFGDGTHACTLKCTSNDTCPSGSQGKKCNGQGYCRP
jgi:hypothetical protein